MPPRCGRAQTSPTRSVIPSVRDRRVPLTTRRPTLGKDESRMVGSTLLKKSVGEGEGWKMMQLKQSTDWRRVSVSFSEFQLSTGESTTLEYSVL